MAKSMIIDAQEKKDDRVHSVLDDRPDYPYGLRITLDPSTLKKLEMGEVPEVGKKVMIMAVAEVIGVNKVKEVGDVDDHSVELQIQEMEVKQEGKEEEERSVAQSLFGANG